MQSQFFAIFQMMSWQSLYLANGTRARTCSSNVRGSIMKGKKCWQGRQDKAAGRVQTRHGRVAGKDKEEGGGMVSASFEGTDGFKQHTKCVPYCFSTQHNAAGRFVLLAPQTHLLGGYRLNETHVGHYPQRDVFFGGVHWHAESVP